MTPDPYRYFRIEAHELLEQLSKGVLDLEKGAGSTDLVLRMLRVTHTLKGAARVVKQREIADLAHDIEGVLAPFRDTLGAAGLPRASIDTVLKLTEGIRERVAALALPVPPAADGESTARSRPVDSAFQTVRADIAEMDALLDGVAETYSQVKSLRGNLAGLAQAHHLSDLLVSLQTPHSLLESGHAAAEQRQRVSEQLGAIIDGVERGMAWSLDQMDRELRQVRDAAEQLRLVRAGALFTTLELSARDVAQALGKQVHFEGRGGELRMDAHVLGTIQGAMVQIVRNAVAHGIESAANRAAAAKPPEGRVTVEIERHARRVSFRCTDDGAGVDLEAVRRAALKKNLPLSEVEKLDAEALLRLLLGGGISTSGVVSSVSGRGIGLDLVRTVVETLGGEVGVRTAPAAGTTVEIIVPLSVASLDAIVIEAAGVVTAVPQNAVRRALHVPSDGVTRTARGESVIHDGEMIPFVPLARILHLGTGSSRDRHSWPTLVVKGASGAAAFGVDRLLGAENIVFRPLPELTPMSPIVAGASIDTEGTPRLVLDADGLIAEALRGDAVTEAPPPARASILVVDDSLTTRMLEQSILESAGFEVGIAASAEEALIEARRRRYALFLVDVEMPGMDGYAFVERVRGEPGLRDIPAIMVTSRGSPEDRKRGEDAGAQGHIVKSEFDQSAFLGHIRRLMAARPAVDAT